IDGLYQFEGFGVDDAGDLAVAAETEDFFAIWVVNDAIFIVSGEADGLEDLEGGQVNNVDGFGFSVADKSFVHLVGEGDAMDAFEAVDGGDRFFGGQVDYVKGGSMRHKEVVIDLVDGHIVVAAVAGDRDLFVEGVLLGVCGGDHGDQQG